MSSSQGIAHFIMAIFGPALLLNGSLPFLQTKVSLLVGLMVYGTLAVAGSLWWARYYPYKGIITSGLDLYFDAWEWLQWAFLVTVALSFLSGLIAAYRFLGVWHWALGIAFLYTCFVVAVTYGCAYLSVTQRLVNE